MKSLLVIGLLFVGAANAETINVTAPADCGTLRQCYGVVTDSDHTVNVFSGTSSYYAYVVIDGVSYKGYPVLPLGTPTFTQFPMQAADGSTLLFTATFTSYRTCTHSGRGQTCLTHYSLVSGTIVR